MCSSYAVQCSAACSTMCSTYITSSCAVCSSDAVLRKTDSQPCGFCVCRWILLLPGLSLPSPSSPYPVIHLPSNSLLTSQPPPPPPHHFSSSPHSLPRPGFAGPGSQCGSDSDADGWADEALDCLEERCSSVLSTVQYSVLNCTVLYSLVQYSNVKYNSF